MCTLVILRRPHHAWPVLIGANRDEMQGRPTLAPGRHWPDRAELVAGLDQLAGGSWMGVNDWGMCAAILNRMGTLGPQDGKRSRGELVLEALDHADAAQAAQALADLDGRSYRAFNMILADNRDAFWVRADGGARVSLHPIAPGLSMISAYDLNDPASPRIRHYLPQFQKATAPNPERNDWGSWASLLADQGQSQGDEEGPAMCFKRADGFGTVSASLIALPAPSDKAKPLWLYADGPPHLASFAEVL